MEASILAKHMMTYYSICDPGFPGADKISWDIIIEKLFIVHRYTKVP